MKCKINYIANKIAKDYKYIYDPKHLKNPGFDFNRTKNGWSNYKFDEKPINTKFIMHSVAKYSPYVFNFEKFMNEEQEKSIQESLSYGLDLSSDDGNDLLGKVKSNSIRKRYEDIVNAKITERTKRAFSRIDKIIKHYTSINHKDEETGKLSRLIGLASNDPTADWKMEKFGFTEPTNETVKNMRLYMKKEQELLLNAGLVDANGEVVVYRRTNHPQNYNGSFVDSWSISPLIKTSNTTTLIKAKIPLERVISSFVGRHMELERNEKGKRIDNHVDKEWKFAEPEYEVVIKSKDLMNCSIINDIDLEQEYYSFKFRLRDLFIDTNKNVNEFNKRSKENKRTIEFLGNYSPTTEEIQKLKNLIYDSDSKIKLPNRKELTTEELIILFKTLRKNGYFDEEWI